MSTILPTDCQRKAFEVININFHLDNKKVCKYVIHVVACSHAVNVVTKSEWNERTKVINNVLNYLF